MKYLRTVEGCTRLDKIRNEDIRNELGISPLSKKIIEYRNKWKAHLHGIEHPAFHYRHIISTIQKTRHRQTKKKMERDTTTLEAGTGDSPNP
jgi:hypothetical protein